MIFSCAKAKHAKDLDSVTDRVQDEMKTDSATMNKVSSPARCARPAMIQIPYLPKVHLQQISMFLPESQVVSYACFASRL